MAHFCQPVGRIAAISTLAVILACTAQGTDPESHCPFTISPQWQQLALDAAPTFPNNCPVKVKPSGVQPPLTFGMTVYDRRNNIGNPLGKLLMVDIRNAVGQTVQLTQPGFTPQANCGGCAGVQLNTQYTPATIPYSLAPNRTSDTARAFIVQVGQTLPGNTFMTVNLTYVPEGNPSILAPATQVWGSPTSFGLSTDSIRRPAQIVWMVDGQHHATTAVPLTVAVDWQSRSLAPGSHYISANVTTGTGKVVTVGKSLEITLPPGCGGGGGPIPMRAPEASPDAPPLRPLAPRQSQPCP